MFREGARFDGRQVQIIAKPAALPVGRFGLVVGRKALRRAVDRNRFRRLVREAFRGAREQTLPYDVIVRLKAPLPRGAVDAAAREAADLLARAVAQMAARSTP